MDNSNELSLSKDLSSYSSFFKTQTSIKDVVHNATESERGTNQHNTTKDEINTNVETNQPPTPVVKADETETNAEIVIISENGTCEHGTTFRKHEEQSVTPLAENGNKNTYSGDHVKEDSLRTVTNATTVREDNTTLLDSDESAAKTDQPKPVISTKTSEHLHINEMKQQEHQELGLDTEADTHPYVQNDTEKTQEREVESPKEQPIVHSNADAEEHKHDAETIAVKEVHTRGEGVLQAVTDEVVNDNTENTSNHNYNKENLNESETANQSLTQDHATESTSKFKNVENVDENHLQAVVISHQTNNREKTDSVEDQMPTDTFVASETDFIKGGSTNRDVVVAGEKPNRIENNSPAEQDYSEAETPKETVNDNEQSVNVDIKSDINNEPSETVLKETTDKDQKNKASTMENNDTVGQLGKDTKLQPNNESPDDKMFKEKSEISNGGNMYFTGRLPTLMNLKERSHSIPINDTMDVESIEESEITEYSTNERNRDENVHQHKPDEQRVPTASKKVKELLDKINEPTEQGGRYPRGDQLTPRTMLRRAKSATSIRTAKTEIIDEIEEVAKENTSGNQNQSTSMTIGDINVYTTKLIRSTNTEDQNSRFDNFTHMQNISQYIHQNVETDSRNGPKDNDKVTNTKTEAYTAEDKTVTVNPKPSPIMEDITKRSKTEENHSVTFENNNTHTVANNNQLEHSPSNTPSSHLTTEIRRSTSEYDLKAIIASAKMARGETAEESDAYENDEMGSSEIANLSLVGGSKPISKNARSFAERNFVREPQDKIVKKDEAMMSLICSRCLQVDRNIHKSGFCTTCQTYLCSTCISVHMMNSTTQSHQISPSYCKNELQRNKYVAATGYCSDCNTFLCMKCTMQHTQLRANRRHRIIQSSFVSKPSERENYTNDILDELQDKLNDDMSESPSLNGTEKKRRKLLTDVKEKNPYRYKFGHVPESIYPGSKKKLATSYTKRPKWPHSSLPALPYLVQPKFIKERFYYPKHLGFHSRKKEIAYMSARLKVLQSRYNLIPEYEKLYSRKDRSYTVSNAVHENESVSLPDIDKGQGHGAGLRCVRQVNEEPKGASGTRKCDFISAHHLTLPVITGEKTTEILAMAVLLNGNLAVIDKNNNNIKIYNKSFNCKAALQFHNRLVDLCASNICPTDLFAATPKHVYEISNEDGLDVRRKMKVEIKRIEGITYWKYGIALISKKTNITWELRLMDYRGNQKSKLEIFNPLTCEIATSQLCHVTTSKGGKRISISDTRNYCVITVDVTSRDVQHESALGAETEPTYLTADSDSNHNIYVSSHNKVYQISKKGKVKGVVVDKTKENETVGSIVCNKSSDRLYVQTGRDTVCVYQLI